MKKVKLGFIAMAILFGVGGAFATRAHLDCRFAQQYHLVGSSYVPVPGQEGVAYVCQDGAGSCTWYQVGSNYALCQTGFYYAIPH